MVLLRGLLRRGHRALCSPSGRGVVRGGAPAFAAGREGGRRRGRRITVAKVCRSRWCRMRVGVSAPASPCPHLTDARSPALPAGLAARLNSTQPPRRVAKRVLSKEELKVLKEKVEEVRMRGVLILAPSCRSRTNGYVHG
jgi:hypothetical protein